MFVMGRLDVVLRNAALVVVCVDYCLLVCYVVVWGCCLVDVRGG